MAAKNLPEMIAKGKQKLTNKADIMGKNYAGMKDVAKRHYNELPFGPNTKAAYNRGIDAATWRAPDPSKWADNWEAKVSL